MVYIRIGLYDKAVDLLCHGGRIVDEMDMRSAFTYGMARWGKIGDIVAEPFARVVELDQGAPTSKEQPTSPQCMAIAYWASGDTETAFEFERRARKAIMYRDSGFSCWRYCSVATSVFREDLDEIRALISGDASRTPRFMVAAAPSLHIDPLFDSSSPTRRIYRGVPKRRF